MYSVIRARNACRLTSIASNLRNSHSEQAEGIQTLKGSLFYSDRCRTVHISNQQQVFNIANVTETYRTAHSRPFRPLSGCFTETGCAGWTALVGRHRGYREQQQTVEAVQIILRCSMCGFLGMGNKESSGRQIRGKGDGTWRVGVRGH